MTRRMSPIHAFISRSGRIVVFVYMLICFLAFPIIVFLHGGPIPTIIFAAVMIRLFASPAPKDNTHGSARWASIVDLVNQRLITNSKGMLLGTVTGLTPPSLRQKLAALLFFPPSRSADAVLVDRASKRTTYTVRVADDHAPHISMVARTGGGKTSLVVANLCEDTSSIFANDAKGLELFHLTGHYRASKLGQKVAVIAPFARPNELGDYAATLNPLQLIDPNSPLALDDLRSIASSLIIPKPNEHNPFFTNAATMAVIAVLACMVLEFPADECSLPHLRHIFAVEKELADVLEFMSERSDAQHRRILSRLAGQILAITGRTYSDVIATVNSELQWIDGSAISDSLSTSTVNPGDWFNHPKGLSIYFSLPPDRLLEYRAYYRVMITSLINFVFRNASDPSNLIRFYCDEAYSLGKLDAIYNALIYGRSYGLRLAFFWQAMSQIGEVFPDNKTDDFIANTASIFAATADFQTAEFISKWIGRSTVASQGGQSGWNYGWSRSNTYGQAGPTIGKNWGFNETTSYNMAQRQLIFAEEILQLPAESAIMLLPHTPPIIGRSKRYFEDKRLMRELATIKRKQLRRNSRSSHLFQRLNPFHRSIPESPTSTD